MGKGKVSGAKSVAAEVFVQKWVEGCKQGLTVAQIAATMGMNPASATVRASQLRKRFKKANIAIELPSPPGGGGGKELDLNKLANIVRDLQK